MTGEKNMDRVKWISEKEVLYKVKIFLASKKNSTAPVVKCATSGAGGPKFESRSFF